MSGGPLRALVVGFGHLGTFHAQKYLALKGEGVELVALVDPRAAELRAKAEQLKPSLPVYATVEEYFAALSAGRVARADLASVATTTEHHRAVGLELISQGVHLLVEKPLAGSPADGLALVNAAEMAGVVLATGQVERHRAIEALRAWNAEPLFLECHRLSPFPARSVDIDVILDLMIHDIDLMLAMVNSPLKSLQASGFSVLTPQIDIANCRFEFENGCVANLTSSRISLTRVRKFRIFSGNSYLSLDLQSGQYERYSRKEGETDPAKAIAQASGTLQVADALFEEIRDFVGAVREGRAPLVSGRDGLRAIELATRVAYDIQARIQRIQGSRRPAP